MPGVSGATVVTNARAFYTTRAAAVHWAPGILHALLGREVLAKLGRMAPRELYACLETVIASEAKQSISPRKERMDCFVASLLAMTIGKKGRAASSVVVPAKAGTHNHRH